MCFAGSHHQASLPHQRHHDTEVDQSKGVDEFSPIVEGWSCLTFTMGDPKSKRKRVVRQEGSEEPLELEMEDGISRWRKAVGDGGRQ